MGYLMLCLNQNPSENEEFEIIFSSDKKLDKIKTSNEMFNLGVQKSISGLWNNQKYIGGDIGTLNFFQNYVFKIEIEKDQSLFLELESSRNSTILLLVFTVKKGDVFDLIKTEI